MTHVAPLIDGNVSSLLIIICSLFTCFPAIILANWSDNVVGRMRQSETDYDLPITFQIPRFSSYEILKDVQDNGTAQQSDAFHENDAANSCGMSLS